MTDPDPLQALVDAAVEDGARALKAEWRSWGYTVSTAGLHPGSTARTVLDAIGYRDTLAELERLRQGFRQLVGFDELVAELSAARKVVEAARLVIDADNAWPAHLIVIHLRKDLAHYDDTRGGSDG